MNSESVTQLLRRIDRGEEAAREQLVGEVYQELHSMAVRYLARERADHTLQPTALVSELYLRLFNGSNEMHLKDREHLLTTAARAMRNLLIDHSRARKSLKRGGEHQREHLDHIVAFYEDRGIRMVEMDDVLNRLAEMDPDLAKIVELRFFGGRTHKEIAEVLGVSERTVERSWSTAKAWLKQNLSPDSKIDASSPVEG